MYNLTKDQIDKRDSIERQVEQLLGNNEPQQTMSIEDVNKILGKSISKREALDILKKAGR